MHAKMRVLVAASVVVLALVIVAGCGKSDPLNRRAISGAVKLDGAPVQHGMVSFMPQQQGGASSGAVINNGRYTVPADKGLPKGKYRVMITAAESGTPTEEQMPGDAPPVTAKELIPEEWNTKSEKVVEVGDEKSYQFDFDIVTKK